MGSTFVENSSRVIAWLLTSALLTVISFPLQAQLSHSTAQRSQAFGYDKAHESTFSGTIESVIAKSAAGSPAGMHVLVTGSQRTLDAHLGPYLSKETKEALHAGTPVQIVGAIENVHGKQYLLARQVIVGGQVVTVRNENGFLMQVQNTSVHAERAHRGIQKSGFVSNGGVR